MKATVVHVVVAGEIGGAERMLVDLATSTARRHVVVALTPRPQIVALFREAGIDVLDRPAPSESPLAQLVRTFGRSDVDWVVRSVRSLGACIVHVHTFQSQVVGTRAGLILGAPVVRTEHSTRAYDDPTCWPFSKWSLARVERAVCVSEHVQRVAMRRAPWAAPKLSVIPNGVNTERFAPVALPPLGNGQPLRLLALGRLDRRKGLDIAIEAVASAPGVVLEIAGEGDERKALESRVRRLGVANRVTFSGYHADVRVAIARAHAVVSSARAEGLGIALLEAMAMGRAVVALPTGGVPEFVRDGETGWLASGGDLAGAIMQASGAGDEVRHRGEAARRLVERDYALPQMRERYERVYEAVERRPRPSAT